ncbi:hypothetical protein [[Kitasatospora] papulosa]|uniref:hypothetical protein n=1 Tax=[Kitasatospora] papulosa TaxID=1464011 RepID=UPI0036C3693F
MAKTTAADRVFTEPNYGWCHWHKGTSGTAVLINIVEQQSGPGFRQYACAPCREQRGLVPYTKAQ